MKHYIQQATASLIRHRADKLADRRDPATALRWYERALRLHPEDASTHYKVGNALMMLNRPAEAALSYDSALKRRADYGDAYYNRGLANLAAVIDPTVFVIGGGVSEAGELLLAPARQTFTEGLTGRGFRPAAEIRPAELGPLAGLVGAADLARRRN